MCVHKEHTRAQQRASDAVEAYVARCGPSTGTASRHVKNSGWAFLITTGRNWVRFVNLCHFLCCRRENRRYGSIAVGTLRLRLPSSCRHLGRSNLGTSRGAPAIDCPAAGAFLIAVVEVRQSGSVLPYLGADIGCLSPMPERHTHRISLLA